MDTVLSIPELVRSIVSQGPEGVMILFSNRKTLEQESCAALYREWAKKGCPDYHVCLSGIGGIETTFCVGRFLVSAAYEFLFSVEQPLIKICSRLDTYINLHENRNGSLFLTFDSGDIKIRMFTLPPDNVRAIISYSGWQKIDDSVTITKEQAKPLLHKILKTTGTYV
eukprot:5446699-Prymnesium_polylepis.2